ncbi:MAG: hypothetical protein IGS48_24105 [Oscillatoriales cyanobacterium C42_A2020_001]|nr:hypothetical protein [Leptolyngbyaceae cyanobacterium C42_A2020_001]
MRLDPSMIRLIWSVIEETQTMHLLSLTDTGLVRLLLQRVSKRILLNGEEVCELYDYISSRTTLIRDMADSQLHSEMPLSPQEAEPAQIAYRRIPLASA